jgi:hypothetical protein
VRPPRVSGRASRASCLSEPWARPAFSSAIPPMPSLESTSPLCESPLHELPEGCAMWALGIRQSGGATASLWLGRAAP